MKDIGGIDPQLKSIAKKIPYNRLMIKLAKPYQTLALKGTKLLEGVACRRISLKENGRNLPVDIYEPAAATEQLPCLLMIHGGAFSYKASAYHKKLACLYVAEVRCRETSLLSGDGENGQLCCNRRFLSDYGRLGTCVNDIPTKLLHKHNDKMKDK